MGQVSVPSSGGINVAPIDREAGPGAGGGASGNRDIFLGQSAGANSTSSNLIVLGNGAGAAGYGTGTNASGLPGSIMIGVSAGAAITGNIIGALAFPNIIIGQNAVKTAVGAAGVIAIGDGIMASMPGTDSVGGPNQIVAIGNRIMNVMATGASGPCQNLVVIGNQIGASGPSAGSAQIIDSVYIGYRAGYTMDAWAGVSSGTVVIGASAVNQAGITSFSANTIIGSGAAQAVNGAPLDNICIGNATANSTLTSPTRNIVIGDSCGLGQDRCVFLGHNITNPTLGGLSRVVAIGCGAGFGAVGVNDSFYVETYDQITQRSLLYGRFDTGNLYVGNSQTNRSDSGNGTNNIKIANGTAGGTPTGGGYFYNVAGKLRWVDTAGIETAISVNAAGQLSNATTAYTNNAAAAAATILNAPVAGNPTKWIPINDNGTIRNIPAW